MIFQFGECVLNTQLVELHFKKKLQAVEPKVFQLLQFLSLDVFHNLLKLEHFSVFLLAFERFYSI